ncbi:DEAD/DEAH box helicase [Luteococcus sp. Sow4_B9]|uniref:DEAD/DEAH box helicase n=1 Tax=Luteococcus sp. Sow4_B9 TaxID=3438792 RepID=UPI003F97C5AB
MSELLPTRQADVLQTALLDYLTTTFALADTDARSALADFLQHQSDGIFKGPYIRTRLPFAPAAEGWEQSLDAIPAGFTPYGHQAAAWARLSSRGKRPDPTLVTTGTGSGKTECFLIPVLDHVLRAKRNPSTSSGIVGAGSGIEGTGSGIAGGSSSLRQAQGTDGMAQGSSGGTKALILYPMNALANDQAQRLTRLLTDKPADGSANPYAGITAALYTGEEGPKRTRVSADGLITSREIIRSQAPDIILTNYKMLDHLLLRSDDAELWRQSANTLQYVILDEFHTYDGAQGTDVAMLLRRLGLTLKSHWTPGQHSPEDEARPLGIITPVGTSATLGDGSDSSDMVSFASEIFGETFDESCVITESRIALDQWLTDATVPDGCTPAALSASLIDDVVANLGDSLDGDVICRGLLSALFRTEDGSPSPTDQLETSDLLRHAKALPILGQLIEATRTAQDLDDLVEQLVPIDARTASPETATAFISLLIAALSHLRATLGRNVASVETHLWVRELTRIDRVASSAVTYQWSDDGALIPLSTDEATEGSDKIAFPAIYCRHCGRSGWGVELATVGTELSANDRNIRTNHAAHTGQFRALISAPTEAARAIDEPIDSLRWLNLNERRITAELPDRDDPDYRHGRLVPVLMLTGSDAGDESRKDTCPSCQQRDGIRFLGSAVATLLSVSLSTLFGSGELDPAEKKALVFTDSVQDAAHRAGFVAARSHTLTMRSVMRDGFTDEAEEKNLDELADAVLRRAGDDPFRRYRLLPSEFVNDPKMAPFWEAQRQSLVPRDVRDKVKRRLLFDLTLEFGLNSRVGRTLEQTGSLSVHVNAGSAAMMATTARTVLRNDNQQTLDDPLADLDDAVLTQWVRGVVEHMRTQGSIEHQWFDNYIRKDGQRWAIWGGRPRNQGMPAFPKGRSAPAFPRIGGSRPHGDPLLDSVSDSQSWYARWTGRCLGIPAQHGARLVRALLDRLGRDLVLRTTPTEGGAIVYGILPSRVLVSPTTDEDLRAGRHQLRCDVCHGQFTGSVESVEQLTGAPCLFARCAGRLSPSAMDAKNFYRTLYASSDMRRIVAHEHTSLLDAKTRLEYENGFKASQADPHSPNTLVATPTLEMGIDIGDLSAVFLASLPRTVASYLQRIGRAGRQTGNALNLAYVTGRGEFLPRLGDPTSLINGAVRPPSIYLSAEEILQRQYLAHLVDRFARDHDDVHHPRTARAALESAAPGTFLGELIDLAEANAVELWTSFVEAFGDTLRPEAKEHLRQWVTPADGPHTSPLAVAVHHASDRWSAHKELLEHRAIGIQESLPALIQAASVAAASEDDQRSLRTAEAALRLTRARIKQLTGEYWISVLEEFGLLPNYTLLGDAATLEVAVTWFDPESGKYQSEDSDIQRPTAQALREFAPGATFYARGWEIAIDAVDLGTEADGIRPWAFCPACGHAQDLAETGREHAATACPRCRAEGMRDAGQRLDVVELTRASAAIRRDEARIDDRTDERKRTRFSIVTAADLDPTAIQSAWYVDGYDFGAQYLNRLTIRWLNMGRRTTTAAAREIAGDPVPTSLFRVCEGCGHIDNSTGSNSMDEHRPWCRFRKDIDEHVRPIALSRTLTTQGVVIPLPWTVTTGDSFALPSLQAALLLGLRDQFGGSPDHIGVAVMPSPNPDGNNIPSLLLHDTVPGGTGYLAELGSAENLWDLLLRAYRTVRDCECQHERRLACHRCLLPLASPQDVDRVSRSSAARHLRAILLAGQESDEEPGDTMGWQTTAQQTVAPSHESHLELRFREAFVAMARHIGATVTESPGRWGNTIHLRLGHAEWKLEPQLEIGNCRPDFVLTSKLPVPKIAIFTDGYAFHATPLHNRIADDAAKRELLRLADIEVLAVTSRDLDAQENASSRPVPEWAQKARLPGLTQMYGFSQSIPDAVLGGPLAILAAWIQAPDPDAWRRFARAVPMLVPISAQLGVPERASLAEIAPALLQSPDQVTGDGSSNSWWWRQGPVGFLARRKPDTQPMLVDVALVLDDSQQALTNDDFRGSWERWLELSNALIFRPLDVTTSIVATSQAGPRPEAQAAPRRIDLSDRWHDVLEIHFAPRIEQLAEELSQLGVAAPDWVGEEVGQYGIPVDFAWPDRKIVVMSDASEEDIRDLESEGWRLVEASATAIVAALEETTA